MTTFDRDPLFDPRISDWLEADPDHAPEIVLETITAALPSIPQRRAWRAPWRFQTMPIYARVAAAAIIGVLLVGGAVYMFSPGGRSGVGVPVPTPATSSTPTTSPCAHHDGIAPGVARTSLRCRAARDVGLTGNRRPVSRWPGSMTRASTSS